MKPAVVLLSGGLDSTTTLAITIAEGYEAYALSYDYGQRHRIEMEAARRVANSLVAKELRVAKIDLRIFIGENAIDYSGYPDCRPAFIAAFETLANLGTKAGVKGAHFRIHAPLIKFSKAEIIHKALELDVDLSLTHSCYDPSPDGLACGNCDSCLFRLKGFREAGVEDPIRYANK